MGGSLPYFALMTVLCLDHGPDRQGGRGRRGCDGAAGSVRADAPGERLHPGAQRGHDAVRRLQRVATASTACSPPRRSGRIANLVGSWIAYWVGYAGRVDILEKHGKKLHIKKSHLEWADRWFERHGDATVFFTRMLPIIRTFISLPAGVARMPFWRFSVLTLAGCIPWVLMLTFIGKQAGDNWEDWKDNLHYVDYAVAAAIVIGGGLPVRPRAPAQEGRRRRPGARIGLSALPLHQALLLGAAPGPGGAAAGVELGPPRAGPAPARLGLRRAAAPTRARRSRWRCTPARRRRWRSRCAASIGRDPHLQALTLLPPAAIGLALRAADRAAARAGCARWRSPRSSPARRCSRPTGGPSGATQPDALDHLAVGLAQAAALVPGVSRSGAALTAARLRGLSRDGRGGAVAARRAARDRRRRRAQGRARGARRRARRAARSRRPWAPRRRCVSALAALPLARGTRWRAVARLPDRARRMALWRSAPVAGAVARPDLGWN